MTRKYGGDRNAPKPPDDIWHELAAAGRDNDQARIDRAAARYREWLRDNGYYVPVQGSQRPDEAQK